MKSWSEYLPQTPLVEGYQIAPKSRVIAFGTEVGPGKLRRRSTARVFAASAVFMLTRNQISIFEHWFEEEVLDGAAPFTWADPISGVVSRWRFDPEQPYEITPETTEFFRLSVRLDKLP